MMRNLITFMYAALLLFTIFMAWHQAARHNRAINQCYTNVGTCLEGGTLWDKENKVAYFCSSTKVVGL